ncbi:TlpA family protein disulfide reductase [Pseudooceanicola onchidii]|uniref:TlpA family protein disulfide reductase n=1 Tax=Pseudooceanicola onchidii TaxID=2562279 RepID=UPI0010AB439C|nr:TlpA disulfide reductase family protein [Pseudooceanicola onchidii]
MPTLSTLMPLLILGSLTLAAVLLRRTQIGRPLAFVAGIGVLTGGFSALVQDPPGDGSTIRDTPVTTLGGEVRDLGQRNGRPLVLNLWATWCGPCRSEMPMMQRIAEAMPDIDVAFANQAETPQQVALYLATEGLSGRDVVLDPDKRLARRFGGAGLPATFFFAADGALVSVFLGEISEAMLRDRIAVIRDRH